MPRIFANSILARNAQEAIDKINASERFAEKQKEKGIRIIKKLFSSKSRKQSSEETGESRIDHISDHLGVVKKEVINIVNLLRGKANDLNLRMTPAKFRQLFGELSPTQLAIINDSKSKYIVVEAGPGSGKTRVLVHKLASLLLMEDVKHEQLLMLTFSRAAATEFKKRLLKLIGNAANYIEIKTFHAKGQSVLKFSKEFIKRTESLKENNYELKSAKVNFMGYWLKEGTEKETMVVLPELYFRNKELQQLVKPNNPEKRG